MAENAVVRMRIDQENKAEAAAVPATIAIALPGADHFELVRLGSKSEIRP